MKREMKCEFYMQEKYKIAYPPEHLKHFFYEQEHAQSELYFNVASLYKQLLNFHMHKNHLVDMGVESC